MDVAANLCSFSAGLASQLRKSGTKRAFDEQATRIRNSYTMGLGDGSGNEKIGQKAKNEQRDCQKAEQKQDRASSRRRHETTRKNLAGFLGGPSLVVPSVVPCNAGSKVARASLPAQNRKGIEVCFSAKSLARAFARYRDD